MRKLCHHRVAFELTLVHLPPGRVNLAYRLMSVSVELETLLAWVMTLLAMARMTWGVIRWVHWWLVEDWQADWALICQAVRLLFVPEGNRNYGTVWT